MSTTIEGLNTPIVALACETRLGTFHFIYMDEPITIHDVDFQDEMIRIDQFYVPHDWFNAIVLCTEETLRDIKLSL